MVKRFKCLCAYAKTHDNYIEVGKLTPSSSFCHHDRQLQDADRCEAGLYSVFKVPVAVSQTLITPSWLECTMNSPPGETHIGRAAIISHVGQTAHALKLAIPEIARHSSDLG